MHERGRARALTTALGPVLAVATVIGLAIWSQQPGTDLRTPDVLGLPVDVARTRAQEAGFRTRVTEQEGPGQAGTVVAQEPRGRSIAGRGSIIDLTVTEGSERTEVPDVTGLPADQAMDVITKAGLEASEIVYSTVDGGQEPGRVLRTEPPAGAGIDLGAGVVIHAAWPE